MNFSQNWSTQGRVTRGMRERDRPVTNRPQGKLFVYLHPLTNKLRLSKTFFNSCGVVFGKVFASK
ncbi:MAG: hypothetical protein F6K23_35560 [Okeania sp. SIO2C9]|uniref:hypothetical protein n=1 Tax=Okeania sp. SIO2C9 TaxID=2607791 RepID=UPI0013C1462E|nr:hypothetical protein [Okeania sp. SIO2C9]NEQ77871.1 hypothetical protein [Okeania sp. SIO2C9]